MIYFFLGLFSSSSLFELGIILYFIFKKEKSNEVVYDYEKLKNEDVDVAIDKSEFFR